MSEQDQSLPEVADRAELLRILTERAREGSVSAAKTLLDEVRRDGDEAPNADEDSFDALDNVTPIKRSA